MPLPRCRNSVAGSTVRRMRAILGALAAGAVIASPPGAHALCIYNGVDSAKTTIPQEFQDSTWVIRAKVLAAEDHWSDETDSWTTYELEVLHAYKGKPSKRLRFFTYRDSGGFYLDRPSVDLPAGHDIGGEYLLFLDPLPVQRDAPSAAKGAVFVNYSCGASSAWADVRPSDRRKLRRLEHHR